MKILTLNDRIKIKAEGVTVTLSPLNYGHRVELYGMVTRRDGDLVPDIGKQTVFMLKHSVKGVDGLEKYDNTPYVLEFDGEVLSDNCANELACCFVNTKLVGALGNALAGQTNIKGVEVDVGPN